MFLVLSLNDWNIPELLKTIQPSIGFWAAVAFIAIAFVIGQFLDAARDVFLENLLFARFCGQVKWEFFLEAKKEAIENLEDWYYTWYEMDANIVMAILFASILGVFKLVSINCLTWILMLIVGFFFFYDAFELRLWTKKMVDHYYANQNRAA